MRPDIDGAGARLARGDRLSVPQAAALLAYIEELERMVAAADASAAGWLAASRHWRAGAHLEPTEEVTG